MTDKQEIRAKSAELALAFMGLLFKLPMADASKEDETGEFNRVFGYVEYFTRKFEQFISVETPALPKQ